MLKKGKVSDASGCASLIVLTLICGLIQWMATSTGGEGVVGWAQTGSRWIADMVVWIGGGVGVLLLIVYFICIAVLFLGYAIRKILELNGYEVQKKKRD